MSGRLYSAGANAAIAMQELEFKGQRLWVIIQREGLKNDSEERNSAQLFGFSMQDHSL